MSSKDMWLASIRETELFQAHGTFAESVPQNVQRDRRNDMDGTLEQIVQDSDVDYEYFEGYCLWEFKSRKTKIGEVDQWVVRRHCWRVNEDGRIVDRAALSTKPRSYLGIGFTADFVRIFRGEVVRAYEKVNESIDHEIDPASTSLPIICSLFLHHAVANTLADHMSSMFSKNLWMAYKQNVCDRFPAPFKPQVCG